MQLEKEMHGVPGWLMVVLLLVLALVSAWFFVQGVEQESGLVILFAVLLLLADLACWFGLTVVNPNMAKVVTVFGVYKGSIKKPGFWWVNPISTRRGGA